MIKYILWQLYNILGKCNWWQT